ncbi:glucose 1-dehydrogenase [Pseudonocardia adelaidensis]|uniref:Glucose 1-dehydrogenase n=1 Tax=Pseudonocardia adelaidensis TaxID=648754 RepID=A0ABP9NE98_9PSEU
MVTGGAGALGAASALRLSADGAVVVLVDVDGDEAARQAERIRTGTGRPAVGHEADVTDEDDVERLVDELGSRFGRLDQLVNAAGRNARGGFAEMRADWDLVVAVNLWAPALLCHASADLLTVGGGAIVNIGSRTWLSGGPAAYAASKAGLVGLTRALAVELGPRGITVNAVAPSMVVTPFTRGGRSDAEFAAIAERHRAMAAIPRLATPEDVAHAVAFLASDRARFITGEVLHVAGGAQLAPRP